jgi:hypothetical protein
MTVEQMFFM